MRLKIKITAFLSLILLAGSNCLAQFYPTQYRPANQQWQYLQTPHFKLVYPAGDDSSALRMGRILEQQYGPVQQLVGGKLSSFPVVLNSHNDRGNGFVTPIHFRSEIELPPIKGKSLNPQTGNWLENVGPHELVHALQLSNLGGLNVPALVSLFSPDLARSIHGAIPFGFLEGIAVHHETEHVAPNGGRGNHPFFYQQFNATFTGDRRWSMGQMVQTTTYTRPFNRHYIGGYEFTAWLQERYGEETTKEALDFYMDWPFLGYGAALRRATGFWPGQLYNRFEEAQEKELSDSQKSRPSFTELAIPFKGREIRRPKWLSDSTLVFYGSFYNARPGFYTYDLSTHRLDRLFATNSVEDFHYDLSGDRSELVYSYYEVSPIYDNTFHAELVRYDLREDKKCQITRNGRLYAPRFDGESIIALQSRAASSALVSIPGTDGPGRATTRLLSAGEHEITAAAPDPAGSNQIAVVANKDGMQALWIAGRDALRQSLEDVPDIAFQNGSVYDPAWHPEENIVLFSSDHTGTLQLYEFHIDRREVRQLTDSRFNAFEAAYSPGGNRLAFSFQKENERLPALLDRTDFNGRLIPEKKWAPAESQPASRNRSLVEDSTITASQTWESGRYVPGAGWLKPRSLLPVSEEISNTGVYRTGLSLYSNDLLQSQSYATELSYAEDRLWYDLAYYNKTFWPGFNASLFSRPGYRTFSFENEQGEGSFERTLLRQERSLALSVPLRISLDRNVYSTAWLIEPELRQSQFRYFEIGRGTETASGFGNITISNLYAQFNFRLQQNIRDLQPNSGLILFAELEHYLNAATLRIDAYGNTLEQTFAKPSALNGGIFSYLAPLGRWNQSLRLGLRVLTQTHPVFDNQSLVSRGFSGRPFASSGNLLSLSARYTIPLAYADEGGLLLPVYLSNIYLVAFSNTVTDPGNRPLPDHSRSVFGLELRAKFRISNLPFDIGVGYGYEPARNNHRFYFGHF